MLNELIGQQKFSDSTLKSFILKNVDFSTKNPVIKELNAFLIERVNTFWDLVVVRLQKSDNFDGNKMNWYFDIYKEGIEAKKLKNNPFLMADIPEAKIAETILTLVEKTVLEYVQLGSTFLANSFALLSAYLRDKMIMLRLEHIYVSDDPYEWILAAEKEEHGKMSEKPADFDQVYNILNNINLIISKRV